MNKKVPSRWIFPGILAFGLIVQSVSAAASGVSYDWHSFAAPGCATTGHVIGTDAGGNIYLRGFSYSNWSGPEGEGPLHAFVGPLDVFILKLDSAGSYQWHSFFSTGTDEYGGGMAVDGSGNVYVTGYSDFSWNGPEGQSPLNPFAGAAFHIFAMKLSSTGLYQWHTFYGASSYNGAIAAAADSANVYLTGWSQATWKGPAGVAPLHAYSGQADIFALKLDSEGQYQWHTFFGSVSNHDEGYGIVADSAGSIYLSGWTEATWDGPSAEPPLNPFPAAGGRNLFALKIDRDGGYQWHTFYAGTTDGSTICVDRERNVYLTGYCSAGWDGPNGQSPLHAFSANSNLLVLKLDSSGAYQWHTFYGSQTMAFGIVCDDQGNSYVTGGSNGTWSGPGGESPAHAHSGGVSDTVVLKLDSAGGYQWHTFNGAGSGNHVWGCGIARAGSRHLVVTGNSNASWNGDSGQIPLSPYATRPGFADFNTFVLKLMDLEPPRFPVLPGLVELLLLQ